MSELTDISGGQSVNESLPTKHWLFQKICDEYFTTRTSWDQICDHHEAGLVTMLAKSLLW